MSLSATGRLPAARAACYYGWINVVVAAAAMTATFPGRTQGLGMVTEPLLHDLGLDRTWYASLNLAATLTGAAFCLPIGGLVDRWGARSVLAAVLLTLGTVVVWMSTVQGWLALLFALTLTRGLGQSALSVVSIVLVAKWFPGRRLGMAMACYSFLVSLGFMGAIKTVSLALVDCALPWRTVWAGVGLVLLAILAPASWLLARSTPEEIGLSVTGEGDTPGAGLLEGCPLGAALRTPAFWAFSLAVSFYGLIASGISLFNEAIFAERGFDRSVFHHALLVTTVTGLASKFAAAWLSERWHINRLLALALLLLTAALLALPLVQTLLHVYLYATVMGAAGGVIALVFFAVWGQVFGRRDVGRIQGIAQMLTVLASALGPLLFASCWEHMGSYVPVFLALAPVAVALAVTCWCVRLPDAEPSAIATPPILTAKAEEDERQNGKSKLGHQMKGTPPEGSHGRGPLRRGW